MTREKALAAIDAGFAFGAQHLFSVLVSSLGTGDDAEGAARRFVAGIESHSRAHALASAEIERIFPE